MQHAHKDLKFAVDLADEVSSKVTTLRNVSINNSDILNGIELN